MQKNECNGIVIRYLCDSVCDFKPKFDRNLEIWLYVTVCVWIHVSSLEIINISHGLIHSKHDDVFSRSETVDDENNGLLAY